MVYDDYDRSEFLKKLDDSSVEATDWEAKFIESNLSRSRFTEGQREVIDEMIERYGLRIKWIRLCP